MNEINEFKLTNDDRYAIECAINIARRFLKTPGLNASKIIGLGKALYALERLPKTTPGAYFEFGISYRAGTKESSEMRYVDFKITESSFEISKGGSVYDCDRGSDSFSDPGWLIQASGYRETECELYDLEDTILEYLNLGAEISVSDESDIEYE
jgi:hypothetical protein